MHINEPRLQLRVLVRIRLLQRARHAWGVRSPDDLLEPAREQRSLGPLRAQAVGQAQGLRLVHLGDELDGVDRDLLVCPGPRLAPDLEVLLDVLPLLGGGTGPMPRPGLAGSCRCRRPR